MKVIFTYRPNKGTPHVAAFSVMETLVAMAVTAIVLGITFAVFTIVSERMLDYKRQNQFVGDLNRLTYSMNKDIFESEKMSGDAQGIDFRDYAGNQVHYRFASDYILRESRMFIDTFELKNSRLTIDSIHNSSRRAVFLRLSLLTEINQNKTRFRFYKRVYPNQMPPIFKP